MQGLPVAAIPDMAPVEDILHKNGRYVAEFKRKYLSPDATYVNSGVLLLDISKLAQKDIEKISIKFPLTYPDQDLLNVLFDRQIKILPLKYNFGPGVTVSAKFDKQEAKAAFFNPSIVHYYTMKAHLSDINDSHCATFWNICRRLKFSKKDFLSLEQKSVTTKTIIPFVHVKNDQIRFFGFRIS
jgi:lipopolysaccharide biosynthesis glycosyltransferase